ncbi:MAG: sirohydrochlorin cobaltochelatase [Oscillospiraceae bacterium]|nr:sirohydrochlorin cobaltochelatase [Oscillospiraceae bacterium]
MSKALLVVSFGTSYAETRKKTIEALEGALASAFPERKAYRAWTSSIIRKKLLRTEGLQIDSVEEAMERMLSQGVTDLLVQPTHMMIGEEYQKAVEGIKAFQGRFSRLALGTPLLTSEEDLRRMAKVLEESFPQVKENELLALMGHGSAVAEPNPYVIVNRALAADGYSRFQIGTVEFEPGFEPLLEAARAGKPEKIWLAPFMVVAGDHACNDMAGEEDSWASRFQAAGFETVSLLRGLGEYSAVQDMYVSHAREAVVL